MKIGFTGTMVGMSQQQKDYFRGIILSLAPDEFHHGDCIGADAEAHDIVVELRSLDYCRPKVVGHPPKNPKSRAFKKCDVLRPELDYLDRNKAIVDECDYLVAAPSGPEKLRSGTWSTVRYAKKKRKTYTVLGR